MKDRASATAVAVSGACKRSIASCWLKHGVVFFALLVVILVAGIAYELYRNSRLSIEKFGFDFWRTTVWDPVAGTFGALPFIWGTLYSALAAMVLSTPIALGIAIGVRIRPFVDYSRLWDSSTWQAS